MEAGVAEDYDTELALLASLSLGIKESEGRVFGAFTFEQGVFQAARRVLPGSDEVDLAGTTKVFGHFPLVLPLERPAIPARQRQAKPTLVSGTSGQPGLPAPLLQRFQRGLGSPQLLGVRLPRHVPVAFPGIP